MANKNNRYVPNKNENLIGKDANLKSANEIAAGQNPKPADKTFAEHELARREASNRPNLDAKIDERRKQLENQKENQEKAQKTKEKDRDHDK